MGDGDGDGGGGGDDSSGERRDLRRLLLALRALRGGDFGVRIAEVYGDPLMEEIADTFNDIAQLNQRITEEIGRVSMTVGRQGQMTDRAAIGPVGGGWSNKINSVNQLISDLITPTTEVARVLSAVARGDLGQKMALEIDGKPVQGEFLRIATTVNTMVDQLSAFSSEVTRVAREVGTEGVLGGQAEVPNVSGTWKDLTDSVNFMASNLTGQVRNIALVATAIANGDLSQKITVDVKGEMLELKNTINSMVDQLSAFASEVTRVAKEVGTEGRLGGQARVEDVAGVWRDLTDNVNQLAGNLTVQLRDVSAVATAIADGDLTRKITVEAQGEILQIKEVINSMVDRLSVFADEVTRVAREVGTEGVLGGQAEVPNVAGTWKDLTDSVNFMASNLTGQVRNIADVTTAVARGDLSRKITADVKGEMLALKNTINSMVDQLSAFA
ncbi:HAMP domain-containing protein, partial [Longimicrobium sp.]|uniref:HAMP domain-containing protein n=1 Tax=Longimicrobium sp. TaxID=2029185 RepID=UPI003B3B8E95